MIDETAGRVHGGLGPTIWRPLADVLAASLTLLAIAWAMSLPRYLGLGFYPQQFFAAMLALVLAIAFALLLVQKLTMSHTPIPALSTPYLLMFTLFSVTQPLQPMSSLSIQIKLLVHIYYRYPHTSTSLLTTVTHHLAP